MAQHPNVRCWGSMEYGELGLGKISGECICAPRLHPSLSGQSIVDIACGEKHSAVVLENGALLTAGCNEDGQLGREDKPNRPEQVAELKEERIIQTCCGKNHTLALTDSGQVFSWGSNSQDQLGRIVKGNDYRVPRRVKKLIAHTVVQIAAGNQHNLALTNKSEVWVWGSNSLCQLGLGNANRCREPQLVQSLLAVPIGRISAGGDHSALLTSSGVLFMCGSNSYGQLGTGKEVPNEAYPTRIKALNSQGIRYVACGANHSVALTKEGRVFTFGSGQEGQLGHCNTDNVSQPRQVAELQGSCFTQVACGSNHTLAYNQTSGRIYVFGGGSKGQLGFPDTASKAVPTQLEGPWVSLTSKKKGVVVNKAFCGGDHTFVTATPKEYSQPPLDLRYVEQRQQTWCLTPEMIERVCALGKERIPEDLSLRLEVVFATPACINASFLVEPDKRRTSTRNNSGVDVPLAVSCLQRLKSLKNVDVVPLVLGSLKDQLLPALQNFADVEALRVFLLLPLLPPVRLCRTLLKELALKLMSLPELLKSVIWSWWGKLPHQVLVELIQAYKLYVVEYLQEKLVPESNVEALAVCAQVTMHACFEVLKLLHQAGSAQTSPTLRYDMFYIPKLQQLVNLRLHYALWIGQNSSQRKAQRFSFFDYPFVFDGTAKTQLLEVDAEMRMKQAMEEVHRRNFESMLQSLFTFNPTIRADSPFLVFRVSRQKLLEDTITCMKNCLKNDYKKPLKICFEGEEAIDEGGVKKEFFLLLVAELLHSQCGLFQYHSDSRLYWFSESALKDVSRFALVGSLCGLAIYNKVIIDLPFPLALYKSLLGRPPDLSDLKELSPTEGRSLQSILDYTEQNFSDIFDLTFSVTRMRGSELQDVELVAGGLHQRLTQENKASFVDAYVKFVFRGAVSAALEAFCHGFHTVIQGDVLRLFEPTELRAMVGGSEQYDWHEWEQHAVYVRSDSTSHPSERLFWKVFHSLDTQTKRKFLFFLTGCDRVPITGMQAIKIHIRSVPTPPSALPVAHTCFNLLDLPQYTSEEQLREKLLLAINETEGFGLV